MAKTIFRHPPGHFFFIQVVKNPESQRPLQRVDFTHQSASEYARIELVGTYLLAAQGE
jgi:hypothetical protein